MTTPPEAQQPRPNEAATDTAKMVKARGVHMYREASDFSEHRMVSGILISPAEIHRIEREPAALAAERTAAVPSVDVQRLARALWRRCECGHAPQHHHPECSVYKCKCQQQTPTIETLTEARAILRRLSPESDNGE